MCELVRTHTHTLHTSLTHTNTHIQPYAKVKIENIDLGLDLGEQKATGEVDFASQLRRGSEQKKKSSHRLSVLSRDTYSIHTDRELTHKHTTTHVKCANTDAHTHTTHTLQGYTHTHAQDTYARGSDSAPCERGGARSESGGIVALPILYTIRRWQRDGEMCVRCVCLCA